MSAPAYRILPCRLAELRQLAVNLRAEDRAEILALGMVPRHALHQLYRLSPDPGAAVIETPSGWQIAACWGDSAPLLAGEGEMWLLTAPVIEQLPLAFFREARAEIARRLTRRWRLRAHVLAEYQRALRFFALLGFTAGPIDPRGFREISIERPYPHPASAARRPPSPALPERGLGVAA